jgi:hypothetical protein
MEKQENLQPRGSLDEKSSLERPENGEKHQMVDSIPSGSETSNTDEPPKDAPVAAKEEEWVYITGVGLILVLVATTFACFLMLLDNSIISTVRETAAAPSIKGLTCTGHSTHHKSVQVTR